MARPNTAALIAAISGLVLCCAFLSAEAQPVVLNGRNKTNPPFMVIRKSVWLAGAECGVALDENGTTVTNTLYEDASDCGPTAQISTVSGNVDSDVLPFDIPVSPLATCASDACCFKACDFVLKNGGACTVQSAPDAPEGSIWLQITGAGDSADFGQIICQARQELAATEAECTLEAYGNTKNVTFDYVATIGGPPDFKLKVTTLNNINNTDSGENTTLTQIGAVACIIQQLDVVDIPGEDF